MAINIQNLSNEELFLALTAGNNEAFEILYERFRNFIKSQIGTILATNTFPTIDYDYLELVAQTAFLTAIVTYNVKTSPFAAYVTVVIKNALTNVVQKQYSPTEKMINYADSLDKQVFADNVNLVLSDIIGSNDSYLDTDNFSNDSVKHIADLTCASFTEIEEKILIAKMEGYSYKEIQAMFDLTKRKLDRIVKTIKEKCLKSYEN